MTDNFLTYYHCYKVYRVADSFPLLPSPSVTLPTSIREEILSQLIRKQTLKLDKQQ